MSKRTNWEKICATSLESVIDGDLISRKVISDASVELADWHDRGAILLHAHDVRKAIISALSHASNIEKIFLSAIKDIERAAGYSANPKFLGRNDVPAERVSNLVNKISGLAEDAGLLEKTVTELNQLRSSTNKCEKAAAEGEYSCSSEPDDHHEWGVYYEAPHNPSLGAEFSPVCFFSSANRALDYANAMNRRNAARRSSIVFYVMKTL